MGVILVLCTICHIYFSLKPTMSSMAAGTFGAKTVINVFNGRPVLWMKKKTLASRPYPLLPPLPTCIPIFQANNCTKAYFLVCPRWLDCFGERIVASEGEHEGVGVRLLPEVFVSRWAKVIWANSLKVLYMRWCLWGYRGGLGKSPQSVNEPMNTVASEPSPKCTSVCESPVTRFRRCAQLTCTQMPAAGLRGPTGVGGRVG